MDEIAIILLVLTFVFALLISAIVMPIVALVKVRRIGDIQRRVQRLEELLAQGQPTPSAEEPVAAAVIEEPPSVAVPARAAALENATAVLETWIGRRLLGWAAVVLLLFATAFFLKHAFENRWIGELGRVAMGILFGAGLCAAGYWYYRRGWRLFSQMMTAAGVVMLYLASFAAFGYYHLVDQQHAALFLVVLVAEAALLAVLYDAPAVALMAVVGALLTPVLLRSAHDQYQSLFLYLLAINAGVVGINWLRPWRVVGTVALVGTHLLFWMWYAGNYHPEKMLAAVGFQAGLFALFLVSGLLVHGLRRRTNPVYDPEPKPWTERWPWLVYIVLAAASAVLLAILVILARTAIKRHDASREPDMGQ